MNGLVGFQYAVLRCVPRVDREEFVNVGVLLYCQETEYLCAASRIDVERVQALAPDLDLAAVASALAAIEAICSGASEMGAAAAVSLTRRFGWLSAPKSTVVQPGPIHGGLTADPAGELRRLVTRLVT